ncbi:MAG: hypothetical protein KIT83_03530 [Bryobacterales bacterium]|nr:hypothetical protein [Bryobacterales bacterium]
MQKQRFARFLRHARMPMLMLAILTLVPLVSSAGVYSTVSENTEEINLPVGKLLLTETVVQEGPMPANRFTMFRLRRALLPSKGTLLLLPSLGNNFRMYLVDESGDPKQSFAAFFARLGYEVWGYSPRETTIKAGDCAGVIDCSPALEWGLQTVVNDVTYIRSQIAMVQPGKLPVIGGFSLGSISAMAVVNQSPADYAGLLAWEGSVASSNAAIQAHNLPFCNQFEGMLAAGVPVDDQSLPFVKLVAQLSQAAPSDPFVLPVPGFPPGLTNSQAFVFILSEPNPFAPSAAPGFIAANGNFSTDTFYFSDGARLAASIAAFNDVTTTRTNRDLHCSLAGVESSFTSQLANFTAPVMIIQGGKGFGPVMDELPGKLGSLSVTINGIPYFGHVDHSGTLAHRFVLELPIAAWLKQVLP